VEVYEWGLGEVQGLQDKFGGQIGRIGRKWSEWLSRAIWASLLVFWSCWFVRVQIFVIRNQKPKLDGVQGLMRFGSCRICHTI